MSTNGADPHYCLNDSVGTIEISSDEFLAVSRGAKTIDALNQIEDLYSLVGESFLEHERFLLTSSLDYLYKEEFGEHDRYLVNKINLNLLSVLNATRAYNDQVPQILNKQKQIPKEVWEIAKQGFRNAYDNSLEYRVMDALRNHSQHQALPIEGILIRRHSMQEDVGPTSILSNPTRLTLEPYLLIDTLLRNKEFKTSTRNELKIRSKRKIDIRWYLRKYIAKFTEAHFSLQKCTQDLLEESEKSLRFAESKLRQTEVEPTYFMEAVRHQNFHSEAYNCSPILAEFLWKKRRRWAGLYQADVTYASSRIVQDVDFDAGD